MNSDELTALITDPHHVISTPLVLVQSLYNQPSRRCLGGTAVLEDNPVSEQDEDPVCEQENNCKNFVFRQCPEWPWGERKERWKLTVPPYIISVLDHKQELLESPVQDSLGNNSNLSPVLGKERGCKTLCLEIEKKIYLCWNLWIYFLGAFSY